MQHKLTRSGSEPATGTAGETTRHAPGHHHGGAEQLLETRYAATAARPEHSRRHL